MAILVGNKAGTGMTRVVRLGKLFTVLVTTPRYDQSTDAILGYITQVDKAFTSLQAAVNYLSDTTEDWDCYYLIQFPNGERYSLWNLQPHTSYYGPIPNIPF